MIDEEDDFGFSLVSGDDIKSTDLETTQSKLEQMRKLIMPLLKNLAKNDDKEYIHWPNRSKKITDVINKINKLVDG